MSIDTSVGRVDGVRVSIDTSVQVSGQGSGSDARAAGYQAEVLERAARLAFLFKGAQRVPGQAHAAAVKVEFAERALELERVADLERLHVLRQLAAVRKLGRQGEIYTLMMNSK